MIFVFKMILSAICMIFGVIYFGYLISYAFASLSSKSTLRFQFQDYLDGLKLFLKVIISFHIISTSFSMQCSQLISIHRLHLVLLCPFLTPDMTQMECSVELHNFLIARYTPIFADISQKNIYDLVSKSI